MYELKDVPEKKKGTEILCEESVFRVPHDHDRLGNRKLQRYICQQFNALTEQQRLALLSLHNIYPYKTPAEQYIGIIRTKAFSIEDDGTGGGVFLEASRINHACNYNSHKSWNENIKRHTVHALRDINEGEEISIYYLAAHNSRQARQEALRAKSKFSCSCRICSLPPEQI
ncbi:hypothetical protein N7448_011276 [Penicillium atrosanguineum]|nr:hypothetical protein N7448_011276 [Penicillium atrosanguineum]